MRKYESYTKSDLFWLQSIPSHWQMEKIGKLFSQVKCKNYGMAETNLLSLSYGTVKRRNINATGGLLPESFEGYNIIESGDIVLRLTDLQNDQKSLRTGLSTERGIITSAYITIRNRSNNLSEYLQMFLHVFDIAKGFYNVGASGVRQGLGWDDIKQFKIAIPSHEEQDQIVRFLNWKVSAINRLISVKRKQIALLRERQIVHISHLVTHGLHRGIATKNSGTTWIGDIPEHWKTMRCKYLFSERDERSKEGTEQHLSMSQKYGLVPDSQLDERRMLSESYAGGKLCYKDDLVLNRLKAHLGVFALSPQPGVISPDYTVLVPDTERVLPAFAETVLKSDRCRGELRIRVRGIIEGFWRLYTDDFNTIVLPVPPIEEQAEIMKYIIEFRDKTKKYEDNLTQEISILQEFKARLISDVVTGKIDVRDIEVPDFEYVEETGDSSDEDDGDMGDASEDEEE